VGLAAALIDRWAPILGRVSLLAGKGGVFKVSLDGDLVFDKKAEGRHAQAGEVEARLEATLGPPLSWK
jgi:predicted Rdx family selenoprotein